MEAAAEEQTHPVHLLVVVVVVVEVVVEVVVVVMAAPVSAVACRSTSVTR